MSDQRSVAPAATIGLEGPSISWHKVQMKVGSKSILRDVSGEVQGGRVCAVMGPSGAGKSSLLNVLAGRSASRGATSVSAYVEIDGKVIDPVAFRKNVAYVMQDDALVPTATPREALQFSAALRLGVAKEQQEKVVEKMLQNLNLTGCADVMIGGELIKGISGGQRKRTSVGVELVTDPSLVFLDEPTSGLDSDSALSCIQLLKSIASQGTTVLCTIHQPSSEVFALFDDIILMKGGRIMYQGAVDGVVPGFTALGYAPPSTHNPADYMMALAAGTADATLEKAGFFKVADNKSALSPKTAEVVATMMTSQTPFFTQFSWLLERELRQSYRDKASLIGRFGVTIFLNLLIGLIFAGAGARDSAHPDGLSAHFGSLVMVSIGSMFGTAQPVMLSFPMERPIFLREYTTGTYSCSAYFIAKGMVEIPLAFIQAMCSYSLIYPLLELQGDFMRLVTSAWGLGIASSSVAVVLGCAVPDVRSVAELAPAVFVPQILFSGFFVRIEQIPVYLRWAQYLCALKYCLNLLVIIEFEDCGKGSNNPAMAKIACEQLFDANNIEKDNYGVYIAVLFALFFGFRLLGSSVLMKKAETFY